MVVAPDNLLHAQHYTIMFLGNMELFFEPYAYT